MPGGTHIPEDECHAMRDMAERGYFHGLIAREFDCSTYTVNYHVQQHCCHQGVEGDAG